jgi:hypothetical protein
MGRGGVVRPPLDRLQRQLSRGGSGVRGDCPKGLCGNRYRNVLARQRTGPGADDLAIHRAALRRPAVERRLRLFGPFSRRTVCGGKTAADCRGFVAAGPTRPDLTDGPGATLVLHGDDGETAAIDCQI